jgi:hypothetical protein
LGDLRLRSFTAASGRHCLYIVDASYGIPQLEDRWTRSPQ